jgi:hypothetical protein
MTDEPIEVIGDEQLVDGIPVLAEVRPIERLPLGSALPAVQAAAVAATGFVAGAATLAVVRRRHARRVARRNPARALEMLPLSGTRTFLVHVHRIGRLEE